jgi:hypothetical protein
MEFAALLSPDEEGTEAFVVVWETAAQEIASITRQNNITILNCNDFMLGFHLNSPCENVIFLQIASQYEPLKNSGIDTAPCLLGGYRRQRTP